MRRTFSILMVVGLVMGAFAAPANAGKKSKVRKQEVRYENPMIGFAGAGACVGCPTFASGAKETFLKAEIVDDVSPIGYVDISYDSDGDGVYDTGVTVCGATEEAVPIPANTSFMAFPSAIPSPFCVGSSTAGTIKLAFSSKP